jgi:YD repeat-containing protein
VDQLWGSAHNSHGEIVRNLAGQPLYSWQYGAGGTVYRSYNSMGALTSIQVTGGSPTTVTYSGACASDTGYPCLPAQQVVGNAPMPPDTTKWYYTGGVVDSVYRSGGPGLGNAGVTRIWHGANARVDSVVDPQGHRQRYEYDVDWGNVSTMLSDSILGKCKLSCPQTIDTTTFEYDSLTGRVHATRHGGTGRVVTVFRDRIARDTMVIDTAAGGASAITTKRRHNDAARTVTVLDGKSQSITFLYDDRGRLVTRTHPASARDSFAYDGNDRVSSWTTQRNQPITYAYDAVGRLRTKTVPNDGTWT